MAKRRCISVQNRINELEKQAEPIKREIMRCRMEKIMSNDKISIQNRIKELEKQAEPIECEIMRLNDVIFNEYILPELQAKYKGKCFMRERRDISEPLELVSVLEVTNNTFAKMLVVQKYSGRVSVEICGRLLPSSGYEEISKEEFERSAASMLYAAMNFCLFGVEL